MTAIFSLDKWFEITQRGTSGDQVTDVLYSWKTDRARLTSELERLRKELDACCEKYNNDIEKLYHAIGNTPPEKSGGFIEGVCEQIKRLQYDLFAANHEIDELRKSLESLKFHKSFCDCSVDITIVNTMVDKALQSNDIDPTP